MGEEEDLPAEIPEATIEEVVAGLPKVTILHDRTPAALSPGRFLNAMVTRVLNTTPVNMHEDARERLRSAAKSDPILDSGARLI